MMVHKVKQLGIDFGSSKTCVVAFLEGKSQPVVICEPRTNCDYFLSYMSPTPDPDRYLYFQGVLRGDGAPMTDLKENFSGKPEKVRLFFKELRRVCEEGTLEKYDFSGLERIVFGYPAYQDPGASELYYRKMSALLAEVFEIDVKQIVGCPEPVLAASAHDHVCAVKSMEKGDVLLVFDLGGYTMDLAVLQMDHGKRTTKVLQYIPSGSIGHHVSMGQYLTARITQFVYGSPSVDCYDPRVEEQKRKLFSSDPEQQGEAHRRTARKYSPEQYPGGKACFSLRYSEAEAADTGDDTVCVSMVEDAEIEDIYGDCGECVDAYLKNAPLAGKRVFVLFTGGTSNIKQFRATILNRLEQYHVQKVWVVDECTDKPFLDGKRTLSSVNAVALGAALVACGRVECITERKMRAKPVKSESAAWNRQLQQTLNRSEAAKNGLISEIRSLIRQNPADLKEKLAALIKYFENP